jgi:protein SCO1
MTRARSVLVALATVSTLRALPAPAQAPLNAAPVHEAPPVSAIVPDILKNVGIEEKLGAPLPMEARFQEADGRPVTLGEIVGRGKPVVMDLVYFDCPMLCGLVQVGMTRALKQSGLRLGQDYLALTVSFDPKDLPAVAAQRQRVALAGLARSEARADWPFLTGKEPEIQALTRAVGFGYAYDQRVGQFAHPAALMVLMPDGRVSRYLYGIEFAPKDVRLAILEAGGGRVGTSLDRILLTCYRYDPASRRYEPYIMGILRLASAAMVLGMAVALGIAWRRERKRGSRS